MANDRKEWLNALLTIVNPVLNALEKGELKKTMPLSFHNERAEFAPLEAFGRSMTGFAPSDEFWSGADEDWSGKKVWSGGHISIDHAED